MNYNEIKQKAIPGLILSRPNGYTGSRVHIQLALIDQRIIEIHEHGCHGCPAVSAADSIEEIQWLIDHHPNFKKYNRIV